MYTKINCGQIYYKIILDLYRKNRPNSKEVFILEMIQQILTILHIYNSLFILLEPKLNILDGLTISEHIYNILGHMSSLNIFKYNGVIGNKLYNTEEFENFGIFFDIMYIMKTMSIIPIMMQLVKQEYITELKTYLQRDDLKIIDYKEIVNLLLEIIYGAIIIMDKKEELYKIEGLMHNTIKLKENGIDMYYSIDILRKILSLESIICLLFTDEKFNFSELNFQDNYDKVYKVYINYKKKRHDVVTTIYTNTFYNCIFNSYINLLKEI